MMTSREIVEQLKAGKLPPAAALRLQDGTVAAEEKPADGAKSIKVRLKARTRDSINHWWWGAIVHDFSTAKLPSKVALDDTHGNEIGYARPTLTDYGLELEGVVIQNPDNPQHESNRIAYNLLNGIPQQASIDWTGEYDLMEIAPNAKASVNGREFTGPLLVVQNWNLRACAICKKGADPTTETVAQFAADAAGAAPGPKSMTTMCPPEPPPTVEAAPAAEVAPVPQSDTATPNEEVAPPVAAAAVEPVPADPEEFDAEEELEDQTLYVELLEQEFDELAAQLELTQEHLTEAQKRLEVLGSAGTAPASFSEAPTQDKKPLWNFPKGLK
jgi:hypothetical protein